MLSIFFIVAREFLEAVLIVSIMSAFLKKQNLQRQGFAYLAYGILGGIALSGLLAFALYHLSEWLEGRGLLYFEAGLFLVSAVLMTQMVFWMRRMGRHLKGNLESDLKTSLTRSGFWGIAIVAALGIGREGAEVATYIYSLSLSDQFNLVSVLAACGLGVAFAVLVYRSINLGMTQLKLSSFFNLTSIFLFLTAGSLLLDVVQRLTELDLLPSLVPVIWNSSTLIPPESIPGQILKLLVGYRPMPSLTMVLTYLAYWLLVFLCYYRPSAKQDSSPRITRAELH